MYLLLVVGYKLRNIFLQKTTAYRRYKDDVPEHIKKERHNRMLDVYRRKCQILNDAEIGNTHLVLVEGKAKKSGKILGRNELYMRVVFEQTEILTEDGGRREAKPGDYVAVKIVGARSATLAAVPLYHNSLSDFYRGNQWGMRAVN